MRLLHISFVTLAMAWTLWGETRTFSKSTASIVEYTGTGISPNCGGLIPNPATTDSAGSTTFSYDLKCANRELKGQVAYSYPVGGLSGTPSPDGLQFLLAPPAPVKLNASLNITLAGVGTYEIAATLGDFVPGTEGCVPSDTGSGNLMITGSCSVAKLGYDSSLHAFLTIQDGFEHLEIDLQVQFTAQSQGASINDLDVVQETTYNPNGPKEVTLIADKPALARVYATSPAPVKNVTAILHGSRGTSSVELPGSPLHPMDGPLPIRSSITVPAAIDRDDAAKSLNFLLPPEWIGAGNLTLKAELQAPPDVKLDPSRTSVSQTVTFVRGASSFSIAYIPFCYQAIPFYSDPICPSDGVSGYDRAIRKLYPINPANIHYFRLFTPLANKNWYPTSYLGLFFFEDSKFKAYLDKIFILSHVDGQSFDQLAGWLPDINARGDTAGSSDPPFSTFPHFTDWGLAFSQGRVFEGFQLSTLLNPEYNDETLAHEIGHNLGLHHTNLGRDEDSSTAWPYSTLTSQAPGFDFVKKTLLPSTLGDLMSYVDPQGISPFDVYNLLLHPLLQPSAANSQQNGPGRATTKSTVGAGSTEQVIISGWAKSDGTDAALDPLYRIPATTVATPSFDGGSHCLHFSNGTGSLGDYCFQLTFQEVDGSSSPLGRQYFTLVVPFPSGATRVGLVTNGQELASLTASSAPPVLTITSPQKGDTWSGGIRTITWTASDPDSRGMAFTVLYSSDGGVSWLPMAVDITDQQFTFDPSQILGGSNVFIRVVATDGMNSTSADVGPVQVIQTPTLTVANSLDFGTATSGDVPIRTLAISNAGSGPLLVQSLSIDNSAFQINSAIGPVGIAGGEKYVVTIQWSPASVGVQTGILTLLSNDPTSPTVTVLLTGAAIAQTGCKFGLSRTASPANGSGGQASVLVTASDDTCTWTSGSDVSWITVNAGSSGSGDGQVSFTVDPNPTTSRRSGTLNIAGITHTVVQQPGGAPLLSVYPNSLDFGIVPSGLTPTRMVTVSNTGAAPLNIKVGSDDPFSVSPLNVQAIVPGASATLTVQFNTAGNTNVQQGNLTITSDDPLNPIVRVRLTGSVASSGNPQISVSPTSIDLGNVTVNQLPPATATVTITNKGTAPLVIQSAGVSGAGYNGLNFPSFPVTVGSVPLQLTVSFSPVAAGAGLTGKLVIASNDPAQPTVTINLTGNGVAAGSAGGTGGTGTGGGTITGITLESGYWDGTNFSELGNWTASPNGCGSTSTSGTWTLGVSAAGSTSNPLLNNADRSVSIAPGNYYIYSTQDTLRDALRITLCWADGRPNDLAVFQRSDYATAAQFTRLSGASTITLGSTGITNASRVPHDGLTPDNSPNDVLQLGIIASTGGGTGTGAGGGTGSSTNPITIPSSANIFAAGRTSVPALQGGGGTLPPYYSIPSGSAGQAVTLTNVSGTFTGCATCATGGPDGSPGGTNLDPASDPVQQAQFQIGISGIRLDTFTGFLVGVFTSDSIAAQPPPAQRNATLDISAPATSPVLNQTFFIGDGMVFTGSGTVQQFQIPPGATRLYLGIADGFSYQGYPGFYGDNSGQFTATVSIVPFAAGGGALQFLLNGADTGSRLNFQSVNIGLGSTFALNVKNPGSSPVTVTSTQISNSSFTSTPQSFSVPAGGTAPLNVTFTPAAAGAQQGVLTLNLAGGGTATLNLSGTGVAGPVIAVNPTNLDFGNVTVNLSPPATAAVSILNKGSAVLTIQSLAISGAGYSIVSAPTTPYNVGDAAAQVVVGFSPGSAGTAFKGTLTIRSNDPSFPVVTVALTGNGVSSTGGGGGTVLAIDNGTVGILAGFPSGAPSAWFVNRLTPPSYPATLRSVLIGFLNDPTTLAPGSAITVVAGSNPSGSSNINGISFTSLSAAVQASDQFNTYAVAPITITSGDFVVGFFAANPPNVFPMGVDTSSGSKSRSYLGNDGVTFTLTDAYPQLAGNFLLRAAVDLGSGGGAPALQFSAPAIDATGTLNITQPGTVQVTAKNPGTALLTVNSIQSSNAAFSASPQSFSVLPGGASTFSVTLAPNATGAQQGTLTFNLAGGGTATLRVASSPAQPASISVLPPSLDFGSVTVNQTKDLTLQISNSGTAPLNITAITPSNPRFALVGSVPSPIQPGLTISVIIRFSPNASGAQSGTLSISSNDPAHPVSTINVTGTGTAASSPSISVSPASLDFGSVTVGQSKDLVLTVSNTGTAALNVTAIQAPSAPFSMLVGALPGSIAAGSSQTITVRYSPTAAGTTSGVLTMSTNDPAHPSVSISLSGTGSSAAAPSISFSPASLDFGSVSVGQFKDLNLLISNTGSAVLSVTVLKPFYDRFSFVNTPPAQIAPGSSFTLTVRFTPSVAGSWTDSVSISSNDTKRPAIDVPVSASATAALAPSISVSASLAFGAVNVGQSKDLVLTVLNIGNATLNVTSIQAPNAPFSMLVGALPGSVAAGSSQTITIRYSPTAAVASTGTLTMSTNDLAHPTVIVSLTGTGSAAPSISASPGSLVFGNVTVGQFKDLTLTISNTGNATLSVSSIGGNSGQFIKQSGDLPGSIPAGGSVPLTIRFTPTSTGAKSGTITFSSNDPTKPTLVVNVSGSGT